MNIIINASPFPWPSSSSSSPTSPPPPRLLPQIPTPLAGHGRRQGTFSLLRFCRLALSWKNSPSFPENFRPGAVCEKEFWTSSCVSWLGIVCVFFSAIFFLVASRSFWSVKGRFFRDLYTCFFGDLVAEFNFASDLLARGCARVFLGFWSIYMDFPYLRYVLFFSSRSWLVLLALVLDHTVKYLSNKSVINIVVIFFCTFLVCGFLPGHIFCAYLSNLFSVFVMLFGFVCNIWFMKVGALRFEGTCCSYCAFIVIFCSWFWAILFGLLKPSVNTWSVISRLHFLPLFFYPSLWFWLCLITIS